jgi:MYXO-CTERM domain-containing protein
MKQYIAASAVALVMASGAAQAAFFSFASDNADTRWTFTGNGSNVTSATGEVPLLLHIDDTNGPAPILQNSVSFLAQYTLTFVGSVNLPGGAQALSYAANGSFSFTDVATGTTLLTTNFSNALFSVRASVNNVWTTTASLQVDDGLGATVSMVWGGANLPAYGLMNGALNGSPRGFSFDLSAINSSGAMPYNGQSPGVAINSVTKLPTQQWWAESSFSASANVIPAPGPLALVGLGALAMRRRRR